MKQVVARVMSEQHDDDKAEFELRHLTEIKITESLWFYLYYRYY